MDRWEFVQYYRKAYHKILFRKQKNVTITMFSEISINIILFITPPSNSLFLYLSHFISLFRLFQFALYKYYITEKEQPSDTLHINIQTHDQASWLCVVYSILFHCHHICVYKRFSCSSLYVIGSIFIFIYPNDRPNRFLGGYLVFYAILSFLISIETAQRTKKYDNSY